jgi:hypothetical protein
VSNREKDAKAERLAAALRDNLRRRKAQSREKSDDVSADDVSSPTPR